MKFVNYKKAGGPYVLQTVDIPKPTVDSYGIMIQVAAAGLNIFDARRRQGIFSYQFDYGSCRGSCLGYECSGTVTAVGSKVHQFKEGDEVCAIVQKGGAYAEFVVVPAADALRIPAGVSLVEAAALPEASRLTLFAFSKVKNIAAGKTILVHGTAGGIDLIIIQYAKHIGCKVFVASEREEKLRICKSLGAEVCINYRKEDFCKRVKAETGETGVDIILDVSGREYFQENMTCVAKGGSIVISGHKTFICVDIDLSLLMKNDISIIGVDLAPMGTSEYLYEWKQLWSDVATKFWPLVEDEHIKPIIGKIFSFTEAAEAHRALEEGCIPGKLLLVPAVATANDDV